MTDIKKPLVQFQNLNIELTKGETKTPLVHDFSLEIFPREVVGLVGESGSGKSITALSILQLLPMPPMGYPSGDIFFEGMSILNAKEKEIRRLRGGDIGCIFQEPMTSLNPLHTIEKQLAESLFLHRGYSRERARAVILEWLSRVELKEPMKKLQAYPHQLSGGERQRVMIAMALINEPKLLIADEPTTALDVTVQAQILALIQKLQSDLNMSVLFISHDLGVVKQLSDRIAVMQAGRLVEVGDAEQVLNRPEHAYTQQLIDAEPSGTPVAVEPSSQRLISAQDARVWFPIKRGVMRKTVGHIKAVDGVSFELKAGQTLGIVGESGSGKSTLAKALLGLEHSEGTLSFVDHELDGSNLRQWQPLRTRMQVVFQDPYGSLSPRMSVLQIISEGLEVNKIGTPDEREQRVMDIMHRVGLDPEMRHRYPNEFSGGQRQRIAIARAMIMEPELVVLDEPTSSLDRTVQFQILELLREFQQEKGTSFVFISHDLKVVKALAHYVLVMKDGKIVEQGEDIFTQPQESYTRALIDTAFQL
jgi:microcin C transport system ATP-binding protein